MLDIAIGLALVFAIFAGLVSGVNEILAQIVGRRGVILRQGIQSLLDGVIAAKKGAAPLTEQLYEHPLVRTLAKPGDEPSYMPAATFSAALVQTLSEGGSLAALRHNLEAKGDHLGKLFGPMLDEANGDIERFEASVEAHFDAVMDRVAGWYKRRTQIVMAVVAVVLAVALNVDAIHIMQRLEHDADLRTRLVQAAADATAAVGVVKSAPAPADGTAGNAAVVDTFEKTATDLKDKIDELQNLEVPIGWPIRSSLPSAVFGWLLAAVAGALGAPFWFDAISKLIAVRGTGKKPEDSAAPSKAAGAAAATPAGAASTAAAAAGTVETPLNDFEATRLTGDDVEALQRALGVSESRIDGVLREELRSALREWQRIQGRTVTGRFDEPTVMTLLYS